MAYRVIVGSVSVLCDTADDALEIIRRLEGATSPRMNVEESPAVNGSRWTTSRVTEFTRLVKDNQRKVLDALTTYHEGRTDEQLMQLLGINDGRKLAGVLTGLYKNAKKVGADPDDLYKKRRVTIGGKSVQEYTLSTAFRRALGKAEDKA